MAGKFRFTFGPWNIHEGGDSFGPVVRKTIETGKKLTIYKKLGFDGIQLHDDDAVPEMKSLTPQQIINRANDLKKVLDDQGLTAEFIAPRLWEDERTIDGGYTANDPDCRKYAIDRSKRAIDIANVLGTDLLVLWKEPISVNQKTARWQQKELYLQLTRCLCMILKSEFV
jgi:xylose isomerase